MLTASPPTFSSASFLSVAGAFVNIVILSGVKYFNGEKNFHWRGLWMYVPRAPVSIAYLDTELGKHTQRSAHHELKIVFTRKF